MTFSFLKPWRLELVMALLLLLSQPSVALTQTHSSLDEILRRRAAALRGRVTAINRQLDSVGRRVPPLAREIERLAKEVEEIEIPAPENEPEENSEPPARKVPFRPPLLRTVQLETPLAIVCRNGRVAILDFDKSSEELEKIVDDKSRLEDFVDAKGATVNAGDFDVEIELTILGSSVFISQKAVQRQPGETQQSALGTSSRLLKRLEEIDPKTSAIQFAAYPDSFDEFRAVRAVLWKRGFAVNWLPMKHGETINISGGGGVSVQ